MEGSSMVEQRLLARFWKSIQQLYDLLFLAVRTRSKVKRVSLARKREVALTCWLLDGGLGA